MSSRAAFRSLGAVLFAFAAFLPVVPAVLAALVGLLAVGLSFVVSERSTSERSAKWLAISMAVMLVSVGVLRGATDYPDGPRWATTLWLFIVLVASVLTALGGRRFLRISSVLAAVAVVLVSVGVAVQYASDPLGLDVFRSHEAAAQAVRAGENPYTDAVRVKNGSPNAGPDEYIEGYSYPPVTLAGYVASDLLLGDSRWISALSLIGIALWALRRAWSDLSGSNTIALLLLAAIPLLRAMIWSGWTEPWTLALFTAAAAAWSSVPISAVLLGLALGTKQYLVLLAPLLVIGLRREPRRVVIAGATAAFSLGLAFVADFDAARFALIERPLGLTFRPDSRSISGLLEAWGVTARPGTAVMLVVAVGVAWSTGRRVLSVGDLFAATAAVLAVGFLLSMAFLNYWFLVACMALLSVILGSHPIRPHSVTRTAAEASV